MNRRAFLSLVVTAPVAAQILPRLAVEKPYRLVDLVESEWFPLPSASIREFVEEFGPLCGASRSTHPNLHPLRADDHSLHLAKYAENMRSLIDNPGTPHGQSRS